MSKFQDFAEDCSIPTEANLLRTVMRAVQKRVPFVRHIVYLWKQIRGESMNKGQVFAEKPPDAILPKGTAR